MFFTFLNKEDPCFLDLSVFINCSPDRVFFYYCNSTIKITLDTYLQMKEWGKENDSDKSCLNQWLTLIEEDLSAWEDLNILKESPFLNELGPYYYIPSNCSIFFYKQNTAENEYISSAELAVLFNLDKTLIIEKDLNKYYKSRKSGKKGSKNKEELITDINNCVAVLCQIENTNRHINYLNKLLEYYYAIVQKEEILPIEPVNMPQRPEKPSEPGSSLNLVSLNGKSKQKQYEQDCMDYSHQLKIYYIKSREYEKACERYKKALHETAEISSDFIFGCLDIINKIEDKVKSANKILNVYNGIITKSFVHQDYQDIQTLNTFSYYLRTGRAHDLQSCINLYEDEKHWTEIKASQERIENTIYYLQNDNKYMKYAEEEIQNLLNSRHKQNEVDEIAEAQ